MARLVLLILGMTFLMGDLIALSFEELASLDKEKATWVEISGFAYQSPEGRWILASDPGLRSCCIGSPHKVKQQVFLEGAVPELKPHAFVALEGEAFISPEYSRIGDLTAYYHLKHAKVVPKPWPWMTLGLIAICVAVGLIKRNETKDK